MPRAKKTPETEALKETKYLEPIELKEIEILELKQQVNILEAKLRKKEIEALTYQSTIKEMSKKEKVASLTDFNDIAKKLDEKRRSYFVKLAKKYELNTEAGKWGFNPLTGEISE